MYLKPIKKKHLAISNLDLYFRIYILRWIIIKISKFEAWSQVPYTATAEALGVGPLHHISTKAPNYTLP